MSTRPRARIRVPPRLLLHHGTNQEAVCDRGEPLTRILDFDASTPMPASTHQGSASFASHGFDRLIGNVARVIQGKDDVIRQAVICLLAEGHLLIEDVPGTGKTSLARAIAATVELTWNRIQFTPDLLPSDVTGVSVFNQGSTEFEFRAGPIFANIVVADEINRASPKTQSALLEVMEEGTVSTDAVVYPVPHPFMVVATQNPIDMEGTYQLPEAQLDRFLMRISVGYPDADAEAMVLRVQKDTAPVDYLSPVLSAADLTDMIHQVRSTEVSPAIEHYIVALATHTRSAPECASGSRPEAAWPCSGRPGPGPRPTGDRSSPRGHQGAGPGRARPSGPPASRGRTAGAQRHRRGAAGPGDRARAPHRGRVRSPGTGQGR